MWARTLSVALQLSAATAALPPLPVPPSQIVRGEDFVGAPAVGNQLHPKIQFEPRASLMHGDSGNTGSTDSAGPLSQDPDVKSALQILGVMLWGPDGTLSGGRADVSNILQPRIGLGAYDPATLEVLAEWFPDDPREYLNLGYMELRLEDNSLLVSGASGRLYVVQRTDGNDGTSFELTREVDIAGSLSPGETLLNSLFDAEGNIWFTTGTLTSTPLGPQSSATIGYVEPDGTVHALHLPDQIIENGIALNGTTAYVVTGPLNGTTTTEGYVWAFTTDSSGGDGVKTVWQALYDAGTHQKPGALTRGGGATPALLGGDYVATTDNADGRIKLLILHQEPREDPDDQVLCAVPLFDEGASSNDVRPTVHFDGERYGVVIQNGYAVPPMMQHAQFLLDVNGAWNNMTGMPGGIVRVDAIPGKGCEVRWESDIKIKSVPALSTKTGILYGYVQEEEFAVDGIYVWYFIAVDWESGELLWKKRAGAGGSYNDNAWPGSVGEGRFYQSLMLGVVWMEDGPETYAEGRSYARNL
ncbi:hypothetical protein DL771_000483 [Monosporascus sp. 5C6A]|nr:hypothetical protein DL771_000483 [Monosporascus sp. 5C6A]